MLTETITITRKTETDSKVIILTASDLIRNREFTDPSMLTVYDFIRGRLSQIIKANYVFYENNDGQLYCLKYRHPIKFL